MAVWGFLLCGACALFFNYQSDGESGIAFGFSMEGTDLKPKPAPKPAVRHH